MREKVSAARLRTPLNIEPPENNPEIEASNVRSIYKLVVRATTLNWSSRYTETGRRDD